ncbi:MAG: glutamine-hydrolyzing carbamoyl-phosphate synthase small subunit [Magnetococcales bacterium]|nr:glutamine-hydrolyzing carbamoyl-phosphate synthase small subunit [Magnetococcales bacterium]NGZ29161.1 glutamine-hydrolyzing carbamoyl-phosphate synthase small subunit [Magnetococcales bacterium]
MAIAPSIITGKNNRAVLCLEDGTQFIGVSLGSQGEEVGEVCFNTSMTGYQEILSDPSYAGQIVTMTAPQIGNVGVNPEDMESERPWVRGFVMKEASRITSNWRSKESLGDFLKRYHIPSIGAIDTRQLVRILRDKGSQRGVISTRDFDRDSLVAKARAWPGLAGMDLTDHVTCHKHFRWEETLWRVPLSNKPSKKVVALDFGVKRNILRHLVSSHCQVTVVPAQTSAEEILERKPDGVFLSNGPGDPDAVKHGIRTIRKLIKASVPLFGICLGHQMLALALDGSTEKMKFGHRGGNHPVQNLLTGQVEVTSQNHGFMVRERDLPTCLEVTHRSLFDGTVEGMRHRELPVFSVQYHPEASPGPHDAHYLFGRFLASMGE